MKQLNAVEGFVKQLPFSAESDGVHVQDDKLRSETSTDTNEIEMKGDNHDSSVTFDEDNFTSRLDEATYYKSLRRQCHLCGVQIWQHTSKPRHYEFS